MTFTQNLKNKTKVKKFSKEISWPLGLILLYFFLFHLQTFITLPTQDTLIELILDFINTQSIFFIFLIALVEGGLILGQYAPGGVVISLSILAAQGDISKIVLLTSVITIAYLIAYSIDYLIGYYGINSLLNKFGLEQKLSRFHRLLNKNALSTIFFSYAETNLASLVAAASGTLRLPFKRFFVYSFFCAMFWNIFWAFIIYTFGNVILSIFGFGYVIVIMVLWMFWVFYKNFLKKEELLI